MITCPKCNKEWIEDSEQGISIEFYGACIACYFCKGTGEQGPGTRKELERVATERSQREKEEISDGFHTFKELYEFRKIYNAMVFNEWAKRGIHHVHKSKRHHDGEIPFGDPNYFIVVAILPTGQISNHYKMKDWDLFHIPETPKAIFEYDGHTPQDTLDRMYGFVNGEYECLGEYCKNDCNKETHCSKGNNHG